MAQNELISRQAALDILQAVLRKGQALDEAFARHEGVVGLEKRDRAFVHALVATTLRRLGQIDAAIKACLDKPQELKAPVHDILRLGTSQLLFLGTPAHAAVDTSVETAAGRNDAAPFKGLVNAVLRRLSREGSQMVKMQDAARLNTPDWLWLSWRKTYGIARARNLAEAHLKEASLDLRAKENASFWAEKLGAKLLPTKSLRLEGSQAVQELEGFSDGAWWVQDAAASLPVLLMGDVAGKRVIDLCAAPGGKAMQLAAAGAKIVAVDRSEKRLGRMKENFLRLGLEAEIVCANALEFTPKEKADIVLLDAPCSATGTIRRHPDVPHLKKPEDVSRMVSLQEKLLKRAVEFVNKGGLLIYAVCSLQPEEAEGQIERFLSSRKDVWRKAATAEEIGGAKELINEKGDIRCLPFHWTELGGLDGFYVARMVRG